MLDTTLAKLAVRAGWAALATVAVFTTAPVCAQEVRREIVQYRDLDLTAEAGQATLTKRIEGAVKRVCDRPVSSAADAMEKRRCKRSSMANATQQMNNAIARAGTSRTGIAANTAVVLYPTGKP